MAPKVTKKAKKAAAGKVRKQASRSTSKKGAAKKAAKKTQTKVQRKSRTAAAATRTTRKTASKKQATRSTSAKRDTSLKESSADLNVADLDDVEDLLETKPPVAKTPREKATRKKTGPSTPMVPRSVKPMPKIAEAELGPELLEFIDAVDKYKQSYCRPFPTWREVFYIFLQLGYQRSDS